MSFRVSFHISFRFSQLRPQCVERLQGVARGQVVGIEAGEFVFDLGGPAAGGGFAIDLCGEQRQIVDQLAGRALAFAFLQPVEHSAGARDHRFRQASEARHLDTVGAVGGTGANLVQEDNAALPFLHPHGGVGQALQFLRQHRQFVEMGGEQAAAAINFVQVLDGGPGDGQPVEGGGAAADFVEDDQRAFAGLVQNCRRLHHLDHEG